MSVRFVDAEREATLLRELAAANRGPLSERGLTAIFSAVLDVMKQELPPSERRRRRRAWQPVSNGSRSSAPGSSAPPSALRQYGRELRRCTRSTPMGLASGRRPRGKFGARDSVADAVRDAQLVVVAVPVGSAVSTVREVLAEAPADATVTDVASTKRALADAIDDPRFVPGHPVAGGDSSGPDRAAAELFDGATWFLTPRAGTEPARVDIVERFVSALGARAVWRDAATTERLLALTSHLPHAPANALMRLAAAEAGALESAGASFREMTRVAVRTARCGPTFPGERRSDRARRE